MSNGGFESRRTRIESDWHGLVGYSVFNQAWCSLAFLGMIDDANGCECVRVRAEWIDVGRPRDVYQFIRERANIGSGSVKEDAADGK